MGGWLGLLGRSSDGREGSGLSSSFGVVGFGELLTSSILVGFVDESLSLLGDESVDRATGFVTLIVWEEREREVSKVKRDVTRRGIRREKSHSSSISFPMSSSKTSSRVMIPMVSPSMSPTS